MAPIPDENTDEPKRESSEVSDMETPPVNITVETDSSDSGEEVSGPAQLGYQPLPQEPHDQDNSHLENGDDEDASEATIDHVITQTLDQHEYPSLPNNDWEAGPDPELEERKDVWNKTRPSAQAMSKDEADSIKSAMSSFTLPSCAQPEWARTVNEDEWKRRLYARLNIPATSKQSTSSPSTSSPSTSSQSAESSSSQLSNAVSKGGADDISFPVSFPPMPQPQLSQKQSNEFERSEVDSKSNVSNDQHSASQTVSGDGVS